jgi:cation:H+ antiporter
VPATIAGFDVWVMLGVVGILVVFAVTGWRVSRSEGLLLLAAYGAYLAWLALA